MTLIFGTDARLGKGTQLRTGTAESVLLGLFWGLFSSVLERNTAGGKGKKRLRSDRYWSSRARILKPDTPGWGKKKQGHVGIRRNEERGYHMTHAKGCAVGELQRLDSRFRATFFYRPRDLRTHLPHTAHMTHAASWSPQCRKNPRKNGLWWWWWWWGVVARRTVFCRTRCGHVRFCETHRINCGRFGEESTCATLVQRGWGVVGYCLLGSNEINERTRQWQISVSS